MKLISKISLLVLLFILSINDAFTQPGPPGGGMGGPPCWPPSTCDPAIPINNGLIFLIVMGLLFGVMKIYKTSQIKNIQG